MKRLYTGVVTLFFSMLLSTAVVPTTVVSAQDLFVPSQTVFYEVETESPRISEELFSLFIGVEANLTDQAVQEQYAELNQLVKQLDQRLQKSRSTERFLKYLFYRVHRTHLKKYQSYATLPDILTDRAYDCVSGTALYALLLDALHINFSVQEMTYHVYLQIPLGDEVALIESTDPLSGLVVGTENVANRLAQYQAEEVDSQVYSRPIRASVGMNELIGLTYFNAAVHFYNQQKPEPARQHLQQAIQWYPAERMQALQALIDAVAAR